MNKKWAVAAACALVAGIALWLTVFRPSDEDRVRAVLTRFVKAVSVKKDDTILSRMGRVKSELKETVTDDVHVDVAELGVSVAGREKLADAATKAGAAYASADCELVGLEIKMDESKTSAKVDGTAVCTGERGGTHRVDKRDVHFLLRNDGGWRITSLDVMAPSQD